VLATLAVLATSVQAASAQVDTTDAELAAVMQASVTGDQTRPNGISLSRWQQLLETSYLETSMTTVMSHPGDPNAPTFTDTDTQIANLSDLLNEDVSGQGNGRWTYNAWQRFPGSWWGVCVTSWTWAQWVIDGIRRFRYKLWTNQHCANNTTKKFYSLANPTTAHYLYDGLYEWCHETGVYKTGVGTRQSHVEGTGVWRATLPQPMPQPGCLWHINVQTGYQMHPSQSRVRTRWQYNMWDS